ncbi:DUF4402 domain-containing protein [Novosphingobium aerophilum]|uniref:DUF4402 domain-containing protein n=1 Tax=Novosphingobium aerophilum TaxID=2839843 RepID=A0A7X1KD16_9SPHN|nr:DUF4402 domain-containing protein [Novosphingobium aerophilum]MBC2652836.1 DUF4402 domain-containing protein [Novosphingobium aerophilum]
MLRCPLALSALRLVGGLIALAGTSSPARAGSIELVASRPLDFGAVVVFGSGTKQVTPDGVVSANGLASVPGTREGPGEFVLRYRPDGRTRAALVLVSITTVASQTVAGSTGSLSGLATDLPGGPGLVMGEARPLRLPPCAETVCETSFRVGGTLTVAGGTRQAAFSFPLQVTARLVSEF